MSLITRKNIFNTFNPLIQAKRYRGKINIQKPKPPHFERAKFLAVAKPFYPKKLEQACDKNVDLWSKYKHDNPYQHLLAKELLKKIESSRLIAFYHMNSMTGEDHFKAEVFFYRQNMSYKNYGKETLRIAVKGTRYEVLSEWYCSHNMIVFSPELKIKELFTACKRFPSLVLLAAIVDNKFVNVEELQQLSLIPNLQAAQTQLVQTLNTAQSQLVSYLTSQQNILVSHLEQRAQELQEDRKEKEQSS